VLTGPGVRTAMTYRDFCEDFLNTECTPIALFSNPQHTYFGYPRGINFSVPFLDASFSQLPGEHQSKHSLDQDTGL
jgi:hypothetical protein